MARVSYYFDEMMSRRANEQLQLRQIRVVMANDVGMTQKSDPEHLAYATESRLVMVTFDRPFAGKTIGNLNHAGLICLSGSQQDVGYIVRVLSEFWDNQSLEGCQGQVFWL
jgi:predicted nuclease of predicted toxin-antitoxin system